MQKSNSWLVSGVLQQTKLFDRIKYLLKRCRLLKPEFYAVILNEL